MDILVDFDSTCVLHKNPGVGQDIKGAQDVLLELVANGHNLILFTMRSNRNGDTGLQDAVSWFRERGIKLYGIQKHPTQEEWTDSPKAYGHLIIDDTGLGIPLIDNEFISERPFVDWKRVREMLVEKGLIKEE